MNLKNIGFQLLVANLIAAFVLVILNFTELSITSAQAIAILAITVWMTFVIIVKKENQKGTVGIILSVACLLLTITFLSIFVSVIESLTLKGIFDAFLATFNASDILALILAIAAVVVAVAIPLKMK